MQDDWNLGHAGRLGYLDAIAELVDYRKVNGASDEQASAGWLHQPHSPPTQTDLRLCINFH